MPSDRATAILQTELDVPLEQLQEALRAAEGGRYQIHMVKKADGSYRRLAEPDPELKVVQRAVLDRMLARVRVSPAAHGFVPGRSIVTNARIHAPTAQAMVSMDLKDAFPSVSRKRVRQTIEWHLGPMIRHAWPSDSRATLASVYDTLTTLCVFEDALPQGAPTSGMLLNMVCGRLDRLVMREIVRPRMSAPHPVIYTRYADDLTFTSPAPFPDDFSALVHSVVKRSGFRVNYRKIVNVTSRQQDLVICGVRIHNQRLALPRSAIRRFRALLDHALAHEADSIPDDVRSRICGTIGLLRMVYDVCPPMLERPLQRLIALHGGWLRSSRPGAGTIDYYEVLT